MSKRAKKCRKKSPICWSTESTELWHSVPKAQTRGRKPRALNPIVFKGRHPESRRFSAGAKDLPCRRSRSWSGSIQPPL